MRILIAACLALAVLSVDGRAGVLVVDNVGGPGSFTSIQAAVDAALPGDTILVDITGIPLADEKVTIDGKALSVLVAHEGDDVKIKELVVRNIPAGQVLTLRGLISINAAQAGMRFQNNPGSLRLYDCYGNGKWGQPVTATTPGRDGEAGGVFTNCDDVILVNCGFGGGEGGALFGGGHLGATDGGDGAIITNSKISAFHTGFGGGGGGNVEPAMNPEPGGTGGDGMIVDGSELYLYGCSVSGGSGGDTVLADGGAGGTGLVQTGATSFLTWDATPLGGAGGEPDDFNAEDGPAGVDAQILGGVNADIASVQTWARQMWSNSPVREGELIELTCSGFEDDLWIFLGFGTGHFVLPKYQGVFALTPPFTNLLYLGPIPFLAFTFSLGAVPPLPVGVDAVELLVQGVMQVDGVGFNLIGPEQIVMLAPPF